jgi:hypothetical protein
MSELIDDPLGYYANHSPITDPREYAELFEGLPVEIPALCQVVQGTILHLGWAERYGVKLSEGRKLEVGLCHVSRMLARLQEIDNRPLTLARALEKRLIGNCRQFSVLLCAILRHQGVPARARCGFAKYFEPGKYEDHWVCEYWKADEQRWVMVDPQLDDFQREYRQITFNPLDVPPDQFLPAGKAYQMCREGLVDPDDFIFGMFPDMHGPWFIRGELVRDLASLNRMELLPQDAWGLIEVEDQNLSEEDMALLDRVATLTLADNASFAKVRSTYENDYRLRVPRIIRSWMDLTGEILRGTFNSEGSDGDSKL